MGDRQKTDELMALLRKFHAGKAGQSPAVLLLEQVRDKAGFDASRTADAVSVGLWPSRGLRLTGYELKVSRSDWVREINDPTKAEVFCGWLDSWVLVTDNPDIVRAGELPEGWGHYGRSGDRLRVIKAPPTFEGPRQLGRSEIVALLKAAESEGERQAWDRAHEQIKAARATADAVSGKAMVAEQLRTLREQVDAFEEALGLKITEPWYRDQPDRAREVGAKVRAVLDGQREVDMMLHRLEMIAESARLLADDAERHWKGVATDA